MSTVALADVIVQALGWSLVHFLWQAALVGVLYAVARTVLPRGNARYVASMLALVALAVLPASTVWREVQALAQPIDAGGMLVVGNGGSAMVATADAATSRLATLRVVLPWLVLAWACGVVLLGLRIVRQWRGLRAVVRAAEALPAWQARAHLLGARLGLGRAVRVLASVRIATPTLVGWVRPVVVMPLAMLACMPAEQVDLILAHELAHLRRFDHVANLFQVVLETLFFYHPVVHWISHDARNERELCCDALALRASGGSRRDFVAALAGLEEFRCDHADLVLAASGGVLVERAWFIAAGAAPKQRRPRVGMLAALIALLGAGIVSAVAWRQDAMQARIGAVLAANGGALRSGLAANLARLPVPFLQEMGAQRQKLAPVALARETSPEPVVAPVMTSVPVGRVAHVAVTDLAIAPPLLQAVASGEPAVRGDPSSDVAAAPQPLRTVAPGYPPQALLNGVQGQVEVQFSLNAAGMPFDLKVVRSTASGAFDAAALAALSHWRYAPRAETGRRYRQTFTFRLDAATAGDAAVASACLVRTGSHICRPVSDAAPETATLRNVR